MRYNDETRPSPAWIEELSTTIGQYFEYKYNVFF